MTVTPEQMVADIATMHPHATRVFQRHEIDFCCGGNVSLQDACKRRGLDTATVVEEIQATLQSSDSSPERWDEVAPDDLIRHILENYHKPLVEELPRIKGLFEKVVAKHGDKDSRLATLQNTFLALEEELVQHMAKEEQILFPMIQSGHGSMADGPISVMREEHDNAGAALARIRELTANYQVPDGACNSWRALWSALESLEVELHEHIHLENNILFPATLRQPG